MLYGIIGKKGSGKTLLMTYLIKKYSEENNIKVFSNYKLNFIEHEIIDFDKLFKEEYEIKNSVVAIDEIYLFADCRMSQTKLNKFISYLMYQTRKSSLDIFYTAVSYYTIDVRLRNGTDGIILPHICVDGIKLQNPELMTSSKMNELIQEKHNIGMQGTFHTDYGVKTFCINNIDKYFKYYSSYQIIKPKI